MIRPANILLLLASLPASSAWAFPENVRHGYESCASCHVNPDGGGALTAYGRGTSEAFMASYAVAGDDHTAGWGSPLYGLAGVLPGWLEIGGDLRAVEYVTEPPAGRGPTSRQWIRMEESLEVAVTPPRAPGLTLDAEVGRYGPDGTVNYRRLYAKLAVSDTVGVKVGHFMPAYGINVPDHTTPTRQELGLGEGREAWAAEAYWLAPRGSLSVTSIAGSTLVVDLNREHPGAYQTDTATGWAARGEIYLGSAATVGLSAMATSNFELGRECAGAFAQVGLAGRSYVLAEADQMLIQPTGGAVTRETVALLKAGYELVSGVIATAEVDTVDAAPGARVGVQLIPVPHVEVGLEARRNWSPGFGNGRNSGLVLVHYWL